MTLHHFINQGNPCSRSSRQEAGGASSSQVRLVSGLGQLLDTLVDVIEAGRSVESSSVPCVRNASCTGVYCSAPAFMYVTNVYSHFRIKAPLLRSLHGDYIHQEFSLTYT